MIAKPIAPKIDWDNPITKKMVFDLLMWEKAGNPVDLVNRLTATKYNTPTNVNGPHGPALHFVLASVQYLDVAYTAILAPTDVISIEAFVSQADWTATTFQTIAAKTEGGGYSLCVNSTGVSAPNLCFAVRVNGGYQFAGYGTGGFAANSWHHVVCSYDGRYAKIYVDGILRSTADAGAVYPIQYAASNSLGIGEDPDGSSPLNPDGLPFGGDMSYVRIWNRALIGEEVKRLFINPMRIYKRPVLSATQTK